MQNSYNRCLAIQKIDIRVKRFEHFIEFSLAFEGDNFFLRYIKSFLKKETKKKKNLKKDIKKNNKKE